MLVLGQILKIRGHWYPPLRYGNNLCTSDKSNAEALSYFYSVFTQEKLPIPTKLTSPYNLISDIDISAHGLKNCPIYCTSAWLCIPTVL